MGIRCRCIKIIRRLWSHMPTKDFDLWFEYWSGCSKVIQNMFSAYKKIHSIKYLNWIFISTFHFTIRIDFPKEVIREESLFTNIIVDETMSLRENHCDDALIYITDTVAPGNLFWMLLLFFLILPKSLIKRD